MIPRLRVFAALLFALALAAPALIAGPPQVPGSRQGRGVSTKKDRSAEEARQQYYAAQAALYSALAHATALEQLAETDEPDMDLARTYVHTINREIQASEGDSVKVGQVKHAVEKQESMKAFRKELAEAMRAIDDAQEAVDGHGSLGPHSKNATAHLLNAMIWLVRLADDVGVQPLPAPGVKALEDARKR
ncbi:MAG: hypothetical protein IRY99_02565 [Isosphaeraceae bacterium]|nr:hypothetical protein [Isosphaeraceae bacterium]